jgi:hypothetical protein
MKKDEVSGACDTYGRREDCIQAFGGEIQRNEMSWKT